jgi:hypothetical protein
MTTKTPGAGLCESCANVKIVETRKGSRFYLCTLSEVDPRFPKYPGIPVLRCAGYTPTESVTVAGGVSPGGLVTP